MYMYMYVTYVTLYSNYILDPSYLLSVLRANKAEQLAASGCTANHASIGIISALVWRWASSQLSVNEDIERMKVIALK